MKTPFAYQEEAIERCVKNNQLVGDECGTGKTLVAIETIRRLRLSGNEVFQRPVLVLCRKQASLQWVDEIRDQEITDPIYRLEEAGRGFPVEGLEDNAWVITHHESISYIFEQLYEIPWSVIVTDECHRFKNRKSRRTGELWRLPSARKIGLSGTLMERLPTDYWANLHWLYPTQFRSFWSFHDRYVETELNWAGYRKDIGLLPSKAVEFATLLAPVVLQRTKNQVKADLPPKIEQHVTIEMLSAQRALYDKIRTADDIIVEFDGRDPLVIANMLALIVRLQQISVDPTLLGFDVGSAKLEWLQGYLEDNPGIPMAIFTRFRHVATKLAGQLKAALVVGGKANTAELFLKGETDYIVGTIDAMGESLNLQRAHTAIFVDQTWSSISMRQAIDRVHRIDITEPKTIVYLHSDKSVDKLVRRALDQKWSEIMLIREFINAA